MKTGEEKQIESSHAILTSNVKMSKYEAEIGQVHGRYLFLQPMHN